MTTKRRRYLGEIVTQDPRIDRFELMDLRDFHTLIDLMHGLTDQAKLHHGAMMLHKAGIRCATAG
jgi:hypothetical protein